jgi:hypothetical protein
MRPAKASSNVVLPAPDGPMMNVMVDCGKTCTVPTHRGGAWGEVGCMMLGAAFRDHALVRECRGASVLYPSHVVEDVAFLDFVVFNVTWRSCQGGVGWRGYEGQSRCPIWTPHRKMRRLGMSVSVLYTTPLARR